MKIYAEAFYASKAWIKTRKAFLQSKGGLCEICKDRGEIVAAKVAHHITHITPENIHNPAITLAWGNLQALCQDCHNRVHHKGASVERYTFGAGGEVIPV